MNIYDFEDKLGNEKRRSVITKIGILPLVDKYINGEEIEFPETYVSAEEYLISLLEKAYTMCDNYLVDVEGYDEGSDEGSDE